MFPKYLLSIFIIPLIALSSPVNAGELKGGITPKYDSQHIINMLKAGGYVVYFRHASTERIGEKKVTKEKLANCKIQRNLSAKGREQSKMIGKAFKQLHIPVGDVYASPYCRTVDTAMLAFGKAKKSDYLHFAIHLDKDKRGPVIAGLRDMMSEKPISHTNTVIVSHTGNLKAAVNIWPREEGEAHVFKPTGNGEFTYVGVIKPSQWQQ